TSEFGEQPPAAVGDFNGDGWTDAVSLTVVTSYGLYYSDGNGGFGSSGTTYNLAAALLDGDYDGDGCRDMLTTLSGTSTISYSCLPAVGTATITIASGAQTVRGDFNGDGIDDIIVTATSGHAQLYFGTGTGVASAIDLGSGSSGWGSYV